MQRNNNQDLSLIYNIPDVFILTETKHFLQTFKSKNYKRTFTTCANVFSYLWYKCDDNIFIKLFKYLMISLNRHFLAFIVLKAACILHFLHNNMKIYWTISKFLCGNFLLLEKGRIILLKFGTEHPKSKSWRVFFTRIFRNVA